MAESCTGGLVGHRLTNIAGSSRYVERGVVVYSNEAKSELLGVPEDLLRAHGAVSAPVAEAMARGDLPHLGGSACGVAITGIAGPDGGTPGQAGGHRVHRGARSAPRPASRCGASASRAGARR